MINKKLKIVLAQINPIVGDLEHNTNKICSIIEKHQNADIIIFPEMVLVGYPLMDHIYDPLIRSRNKKSIEKIKNLDSEPAVIFGTFTEPEEIRDKIHPFYNSAIVIKNKEIKAIINKRILPDYDVFNERRYFTFDTNYQPTHINGLKVGILICEDIWDENYDIKVAKQLVENKAEILIVINASPYNIDKFDIRKNLVCKKAREFLVPIVYVNMVGGIDEIVYDGQSFIVDENGELIYKAKAFQEEIAAINIFDSEQKNIKDYRLDWREEVLRALKLNLYDYYYKNKIFDGVVLGLSGGIDSAFTAYVCAKTLGPEKVNAIMLPTRFTSQESLKLAEDFCMNVNINYKIHYIDDLFDLYQKNIESNVGKLEFDIADENLQARIRATILMYYSNKFNWLLISTGNKSEIGVGYCTLYGDTNGGKNIPGDLFKTQIYSICKWINTKNEVIPRGIISRPPTAELRENQKDEDSLPPYKILDIILEEIIKHGIGSELEHIKSKTIDQETIDKVRKLYLNSEYKRRQLVQTIKVSESAFGIGRKYPVLKRIKF
ncbi:MAG: NAD+ synthase [Promethearchaeota archaeon]